jgi:hypothetical protein
MFEYFYHETLRRTIIGFGTLFNNILLKKKNDSGAVVQVAKVPLAYGPTQKFLARLEQSPPDLNNPVQITLPRMSFEFVGLFYDTSRKLTTTQTFLAVDGNSDVRKAFMPVPYTMQFELNIMTKLNDDMLQIIEQVLPYFQPSYTLTVDLIDTIGEKRDIPITIENISMKDDYEGDFTTRRSLIYTIRFSAKTYLFGPVSTGAERDIIKKVSIGYVAGSAGSGSIGRDVTYSTTPVATTSYTDNIVATISEDVAIGSGSFVVSDASQIEQKSYIVIGNETLYVKSKTGNTLSVTRGAYGTTITNHVSGQEIKLITTSDNDLIPIGDEFGFDSSF